MGFRTVRWPSAERLSEAVGALLCTHWPSSESELARILERHGCQTVEGSRSAHEEGLVEYDFTARESDLSGQWYIENGELAAIVLTFGGTRAEIWQHFERNRVGFERSFGVPRYESGKSGAPRLTWARLTHELSLDAYWSQPETSILMMALQRR